MSRIAIGVISTLVILHAFGKVTLSGFALALMVIALTVFLAFTLVKLLAAVGLWKILSSELRLKSDDDRDKTNI